LARRNGINASWAQQKAISAVLPGVILTDGTRDIIDKATGTKVENVPYVSPTDTVAKLLAPGGTSRYDLMISNTFFVKGPISLAPRPAKKKSGPST
jgi:hypothetical protein